MPRYNADAKTGISVVSSEFLVSYSPRLLSNFAIPDKDD